MSDKSPAFAVFVSYAKADQTKAEGIVASLEERGFKCWIAPRDVHPGHPYGDEIIWGIEKSQAFILVLSAASNESTFVAREIERAVSKKKPIFTIRVEAVEPSPSLELFISGTQWIDALSGGLGAAIDRLANLLQEEEGNKPATVSVARVSPASHALRWRSPWVLGVAVLLAGVGGALLWNFQGQESKHLPPSTATESTLKPEVAVVTPPEASQPKSENVEPAVITIPKPELTTKYKPGDTFKDCDVCPEMVVIPPGEFIMGSPPEEKYDVYKWERPQHSVRIASAFAVGKYEVTKDQFSVFVNDSGYDGRSRCESLGMNVAVKIDPPEQTTHYFRNPGFRQGGNEPAVCISWKDATAYVAWLSKKTGKPYRLLSESEWEYVARAGSQLRLVSAPGEAQLCEYANLYDASARQGREAIFDLEVNCSDGYVYTAPVGAFAPNNFGVYDMLGNAIEIVEDCFHTDYIGAPQDGTAWTDCEPFFGKRQSVVRGGSFQTRPQYVRPAFRTSLGNPGPDFGLSRSTYA